MWQYYIIYKYLKALGGILFVPHKYAPGPDDTYRTLPTMLICLRFPATVFIFQLFEFLKNNLMTLSQTYGTQCFQTFNYTQNFPHCASDC